MFKNFLKMFINTLKKVKNLSAFNFKFPHNIDSEDIFTFRQVIITVLKSQMLTDNFGQNKKMFGLSEIGSILNQRLEEKLINAAKKSFQNTVKEITKKVETSKTAGSFIGKTKGFINDLKGKVDSVVKGVNDSVNGLVSSLNEATNNDFFKEVGLDDLKLGDMIKESVSNTAEKYINQIKANTLGKAEALLGSYVNSVNKILDSLRGEIQGSITLPLPKTFSENLNHSWNESTGPMKEIMDAVKGSVEDVTKGTGEIVGKITKNEKVRKAFSNGFNFVGDILGSGITAGEKLLDISNLASAQSGNRFYIDNPDFTQKYGGTKPREFSFKWDLMPNNIKEAQTILNIINALKKYSSPEEYNGTLISPYFFKIQFTNQKLHYLISPSILVLTKVASSFGDNGIYTTLDGNPKTISIDLDFSEVRAPNQNSFSNNEFFQTGESRLHIGSNRYGAGAMLTTGMEAISGLAVDVRDGFSRLGKELGLDFSPNQGTTGDKNLNTDIQNKENSGDQETKAKFDNNVKVENTENSKIKNEVKRYNEALNTNNSTQTTETKAIQSTPEINAAKQDGSYDTLTKGQKDNIERALKANNLPAANIYLKTYKKQNELNKKN